MTKKYNLIINTMSWQTPTYYQLIVLMFIQLHEMIICQYNE